MDTFTILKSQSTYTGKMATALAVIAGVILFSFCAYVGGSRQAAAYELAGRV